MVHASQAAIASPFDAQKDAALDPDLQFSAPLSTHATTTRRIFLTGATGLLGGHLLNELLQTSGADVYCLVRADSPEQGVHRLHAHLKALELDCSAFAARIHVVPGNLEQPRLGVSAEQLDVLAERIDVIYHCAAKVQLAPPYATLRTVNVLGTKEILRLAAARVTKPVHFASSMAVFFGPAHVEADCVSELDRPDIVGVRSGYTQSKWVAEQLIETARARGLPAVIYRTARITGHSQTGATSSSDDLLNSFLRGCILLAAYPDVQLALAMVPVDYVSRAMIHLSRQPGSLGRAFHLVQPRPIPFSDLVQILRQLGYPLTALPKDVWLARLRQEAAGAHPQRAALAQLWIALQAPNSLFTARPRYDTPNTREGLAGTAIACPLIDEALIASYIAFFQKIGYLPTALDAPRSLTME